MYGYRWHHVFTYRVRLPFNCLLSFSISDSCCWNLCPPFVQWVNLYKLHIDIWVYKKIQVLEKRVYWNSVKNKWICPFTRIFAHSYHSDSYLYSIFNLFVINKSFQCWRHQYNINYFMPIACNPTETKGPLCAVSIVTLYSLHQTAVGHLHRQLIQHLRNSWIS